jgi:hypothetical protein
MKIQDLFEERQPNMTYTEKRIKGALDKVTLALEGSDSAAMSRLTKRYERLDRSAKLLKEKRDEVNLHIKTVGDRLFNAEDAVVTRVIETVSCTIMLTAAEKAESKQDTKKVDYEAAFFELSKLVPELTAKIDEITAKYTEIVKAKDTPTALRVKLKDGVKPGEAIKEGFMDDMKAKLKGWLDSFKTWAAGYFMDDMKAKLKGWLDSFKTWAAGYDKKLAAVRAMVKK